MNSTSKILTALAAGAALGLATGILFAPDKGSETRKKIKDKGRKLSEEVKNKINEGKEKANHLKDNLRESLTDITKKFA
jgi:gas vesicle protein